MVSKSDEQLFYGRLVKESVHELGHLAHCDSKRCVMHFSNYSVMRTSRREVFVIVALANGPVTYSTNVIFKPWSLKALSKIVL
jgi:peptidase M54-like protein